MNQKPIHDSAAKGYTAAANTYVSGRPDYPPAIVNWLRDVVGLDATRTVLDLGAGTGKNLPNLRATGARLIAVEPVAAMRALLAERYENVEVLDGTAEQIPLADATVDAVVCAQSFHWFANAAALAEIRRVLKPGGVLGLIWNVRDESIAWVAQLERLTDALRGDTPRFRTGAWRTLFPAEGFEALGEQQFPHAHTGPTGQVIIDRTLSVSFIAALPEQKREQVRQQVQALIDSTPELAGHDTVSFPYQTLAVAFRKTA